MPSPATPITPESHDEDRDAKTMQGIFDEAVERLKISDEAESENRIRGINAKAFINGDQWDADVQNQRTVARRPALTINHTNTECQRLKNMLRQQRPRIKVHPTGGGAKIEKANIIAGVIRHIEDKSNASVAYDNGVESAVDIGWGYWRIVGEYVSPMSFDQELLIKPIRNTFKVYMDPASIMPAGEDQQWCIITETMSRREYRRKYPKAENTEWRADAPGDASLDWENKETIRLAEYYRIHEVSDTLYMMTDGRSALKSELPDEESMAAANWQVAVDRNGKRIERKTTRRQVEWYRINGSVVVEKRVLPGRFIPVIRCEGNVLDLNGRVMRKGMVQDLMDPARMFNYWRSAQTERYALTPKAPWVAAEGQIEGRPEWQDANIQSYSVLIYKPIAGPDGMTMIPPPMRQPPAQVEAGMTEAANGAVADLMAVAGRSPESPELSARIVSGNKHLQRRQGMQDLVHFQYYDKQTLAIMWTGLVLLDLMRHYYDTDRMQRIIGEDGMPEMVRINPNDEEADPEKAAIFAIAKNLELDNYDVVMDTGPGYATKREEGAQNMIELLNTPLAEPIVKTGADLVVRNMDFAGSDELADRLAIETPEGMEKTLEGLPKQAQTIVKSLMAKNQQQQQLIQQQALEIKYHGSVKAAEIESRNNIANQSDGTKRYIAELQSTDKRDVAEINAATQLMNSQMESAQEEKMADKLIAEGVSAAAKD